MRVGHQRAGNRDGQCAGVGHLAHGIGFQVFPPLSPRRKARARGESRTVDGAGQRRTQFVTEERGGISHNLENFGFETGAGVAGGHKVADEFPRESDRRTLGHTEAEKLLWFHDGIC